MKKEAIINLLNDNDIGFPSPIDVKRTSVEFFTAYGFIRARIPEIDEYHDDYVILHPSYVFAGGGGESLGTYAMDYNSILSVVRTK